MIHFKNYLRSSSQELTHTDTFSLQTVWHVHFQTGMLMLLALSPITLKQKFKDG